MSERAIVSVLVPAKDEAENLPEFLRQCAEAFPKVGAPTEVVVVDDGSRDGTPQVLAQLQLQYPFLRVVTHRQQRGIADALRSAGDAAEGDVFVFYPADLQYKPEDIPQLVAPILAGSADIVTGTKQGKYEKAFVSTVYNTLCRWLFGVRVTDLNSVKAYRREVMAHVPMRPDWHRFMVVIAAADGFRLTSTPVPLYPRTAGTSKFTWTRIPIGVLDLLSVWFQLRFGRKPMLFFGLAGALLFLLGFVAGVVAIVLRFTIRADVALLVSLVQTLLIMGVVLFGFGFLGELVANLREEQRELVRRVESERRD
ncbi:MAG: glycosyltransferase family 2 protein [Gemmatimonadales bacterium]|nr:glycosyltransferase family 2 protein [Gemmatimonadales bacterium]MBP9899248.1 glycosyltransferase family 2 protein [Gemmatimonadales bacterium]